MKSLILSNNIILMKFLNDAGWTVLHEKTYRNKITAKDVPKIAPTISSISEYIHVFE